MPNLISKFTIHLLTNVKYGIIRRLILESLRILSAGIYIFKVKSRNNSARCDICPELTIKTPERCQWCRLKFEIEISCVFMVNFEHI